MSLWKKFRDKLADRPEDSLDTIQRVMEYEERTGTRVPDHETPWSARDWILLSSVIAFAFFVWLLLR